MAERERNAAGCGLLRESLAGPVEEQLMRRGGELAQALVDRAAGGDLKAFGTIREIIGEREAGPARALPEDLSALSAEELAELRDYYRGLLGEAEERGDGGGA
jgi:hypothetical protein